ncbi:MAG TPA: hypothetical protein VKS21_13225 [Spirochaetota bacterium]|nr:hypothetical protein [Spirochaetota bacterium]
MQFKNFFLICLLLSAAVYSSIRQMPLGAVLIDDFQAEDAGLGYWGGQLNDLNGDRGVGDDTDEVLWTNAQGEKVYDYLNTLHPFSPINWHPFSNAISTINGVVSTEQYLGYEVDGASYKITYNQVYDYKYETDDTNVQNEEANYPFFDGYCYFYEMFDPIPDIYPSRTNRINLQNLTHFTFWIYPKEGDFDFAVRLILDIPNGDFDLNGNPKPKYSGRVPVKDYLYTAEGDINSKEWLKIKIPLDAFLGPNGDANMKSETVLSSHFINTIKGYTFDFGYLGTNGTQADSSSGTFYLDNVMLVNENEKLGHWLEKESVFSNFSMQEVYVMDHKKSWGDPMATNDSLQFAFRLKKDVGNLNLKIYNKNYEIVYAEDIGAANGNTVYTYTYNFLNHFGNIIKPGPYNLVLTAENSGRGSQIRRSFLLVR